MKYTSKAVLVKMRPWVLKRYKLASLTLMHTSTVSLHDCVLVFITLKSLWDIYTTLGKNGRKLFIFFYPHTHTRINTRSDTHTERNQSLRDEAVNISVNTSNCLPASELASVNPA